MLPGSGLGHARLPGRGQRRRGIRVQPCRAPSSSAWREQKAGGRAAGVLTGRATLLAEAETRSSPRGDAVAAASGGRVGGAGLGAAGRFGASLRRALAGAAVGEAAAGPGPEQDSCPTFSRSRGPWPR